MNRRILIVGLGNPFAADDGAGPAVAERLVAAGLPPGVRVEIGGTDALRIVSFWKGEPEVWLIDAVRRDAPPGSIHRLDHDALLAVPQPHDSVHALGLPECLRWIAISHAPMAGVRYRLWGVEPQRVVAAAGMTALVRDAIEPLALEILAAAGP